MSAVLCYMVTILVKGDRLHREVILVKLHREVVLVKLHREVVLVKGDSRGRAQV